MLLNVITISVVVVLSAFVLLLLAGWLLLRSRGMHYWMGTYIAERARRKVPAALEEVHVLICVADHYEPKFGQAPDERARERVERWRQGYPEQFGRFRDSDGHTPKHTFFFPPEQYEPHLLDSLGQLCRSGFGEVEVHLHHEGDTSESLRHKLVEYVNVLSRRHGFLARDRHSEGIKYGFVHGDWALDNSHPDGLHCGVNNEIDVLRETGCYADFTLPSAPSPTQTRKINSLYYAVDDPGRPKSHDWGIDVGTAPAPGGGLMIVQGPLVLDWGRRKWGFIPRIENGYLQANQPPTPRRLDLWVKAHVQVIKRPDWFFVKLHAHGATEWHSKVLLGEPMVRLHEELARRARENPHFKYHYVTAREMYNLARAAESGWTGSVNEARDYELVCEYARASASV